jgi:hypothetical protein
MPALRQSDVNRTARCGAITDLDPLYVFGNVKRQLQKRRRTIEKFCDVVG